QDSDVAGGERGRIHKLVVELPPGGEFELHGLRQRGDDPSGFAAAVGRERGEQVAEVAGHGIGTAAFRGRERRALDKPGGFVASPGSEAVASCRVCLTTPSMLLCSASSRV